MDLCGQNAVYTLFFKHSTHEASTLSKIKWRNRSKLQGTPPPKKCKNSGLGSKPKTLKSESTIIYTKVWAFSCLIHKHTPCCQSHNKQNCEERMQTKAVQPSADSWMEKRRLVGSWCLTYTRAGEKNESDSSSYKNTHNRMYLVCFLFFLPTSNWIGCRIHYSQKH